MYAWIITKDHMDPDAVLACGPHGADKSKIAELKSGFGHAFRMRDDDGELYYCGRLFGDKNSEEGFAPLDDYGMPNAGCTSIEYRDESGQWKIL